MCKSALNRLALAVKTGRDASTLKEARDQGERVLLPCREQGGNRVGIMPGRKPCGELEAAHHDKRGNDGHIRLFKGMRGGCSPIPLEPCGDKVRQIRTRLDKAERSGKVEEVPAVSTVVKIKKFENIAFYEEICKAHVGMDESKTLARFAISGHDAANARLSALKKRPFSGGKASENAPVTPKSMGAKRGVTVPDRAGDRRYEGSTGRSSSPKTTHLFAQRNARPEPLV